MKFVDQLINITTLVHVSNNLVEIILLIQEKNMSKRYWYYPNWSKILI